ncbi:MAG: hypothetical protein WKG00_12615 [Polyangiaceae bacterium]
MVSPRILRAVRIVAVLVAVCGAGWQIGLLLNLWRGRFDYPLDLEWLEGAALYQGFRVKLGLATYGPPQNGYLPLFHPPLFPTTLGLLGHVLPLGYAMARTFSLLCILGSCALVARGLRRQEPERVDAWTLGLVAAGIAAAGVPLVEGFYDMVREDSMALFLCVLAAALADVPARGRMDSARRRMSVRRVVAIAMVLTAVLYTRLPYVFMMTWVVVFVFARNRPMGVLLATVTIALCGLVLVAVQYGTRGWYWMYTVSLLQDHVIDAKRLALAAHLVLGHVPYLVALPVVALLLAVFHKLTARTVLWFGMLMAALPASLLPFIKVGGFVNDLIPIAFLLGPATAFLLSDVARALGRRPRLSFGVRHGAYVAVGVFLVLRTYSQARLLPTAGHWAKARVLTARVAELEGGAICSRHPFLPISAGHTNGQYSDMPYLDAVWSNFTSLDLGRYIDRSAARYALVSGTEVVLSAQELASRYQLDGTLEAPDMIIGERSRLRYLLRRQDEEKDPRVVFDFEGEIEGWKATGDAFTASPTTARPGWQRGIGGVVGQRLMNSYHPAKKDAATGEMASPAFTIDRSKLSLRLGGGGDRNRVELRVGGRPVRKASSVFRTQEVLIKVVWDVSDLRGQQAQLVLVDGDAGSWGHLLCDQVVLSE